MTPLLLATHGRCGGTVLMDALARHPDIVACRLWPHEQRPACHLMLVRHRIALRRGEASRPARAHEASPFRRVYDASAYGPGGSPFHSSEALEEGLFQSHVLDGVDTALRETCTAFYRSLAASYGKPAASHFLEKGTPELADQFHAVFGTARVLFLIRDPRDAVVSARAFFAAAGGETAAANQAAYASDGYVTRWREIVDALRRAAGRADTHVVRYEELVRDPRSVLSELVRCVGAPVDSLEACLNAFSNAAHPSHRTARDTPATIGRWRTDLAAGDRRRLDETLGSIARELGYA
jgi:hypothetical protein